MDAFFDLLGVEEVMFFLVSGWLCRVILDEEWGRPALGWVGRV